MPMLFLKELSQYRGATRITNPVEIEWALLLLHRGFIDADIERPLASNGKSAPPMQVLVHGLTAQGWAVMAILAPAKKPSWLERLGFGMRKTAAAG
ncbi:hypothetical protein [Rhodoferax sp.]|uniref:hypothetical protein n=1 Tax=Rhodoferax sp. TaxID=50421 RepID=UPI00374D7CDA